MASLVNMMMVMVMWSMVMISMMGASIHWLAVFSCGQVRILACYAGPMLMRLTLMTMMVSRALISHMFG